MKHMEAKCFSRRNRSKDALILLKDTSKQKIPSDLKYSLNISDEQDNSYRPLEEARSCITAGRKSFQNVLKLHLRITSIVPQKKYIILRTF